MKTFFRLFLALLPGECHHFFYTEPAAAHKLIRDFL